eukprot:TRINITY_DN6562_c0_g1_i11.p4 TRINITY_DN6562_c0_g1~~TRINITY_DN6562_c0_g1_i11.p4  ORF type:complete len:121 (-),score=22.98 TRINITY_DN6562_c0_g1_i11:245-607(-)
MDFLKGDIDQMHQENSNDDDVDNDDGEENYDDVDNGDGEENYDDDISNNYENQEPTIEDLEKRGQVRQIHPIDESFMQEPLLRLAPPLTQFHFGQNEVLRGNKQAQVFQQSKSNKRMRRK